MSRSPKYSGVSASAERQRRAREEREERERKRRAAREQREREELEAARTAATGRLAELIAACDAVAAQPGARRSDTAPLSAVLERSRGLIDAATSAKQVRKADRAIAEVELARAEASAAILRRGMRTGTEQVTQLRSTLDGMRATDRSRFDRAGADSADVAVRELEAALSRGDLTAFSARISEAVDIVRTHRATVAESVAHHVEQTGAATAQARELAARLDDLTAVVAAAGASPEAVVLAGVVLEQIRSELAADEPQDALNLAERLDARLPAVEREVDDAIERFGERRDMLGAIVDALPGLGFAVDSTSVITGEDGSVALRATPRRGEPLVVVIDDDATDQHRVNYVREGHDEDIVMDATSCGSLGELAEHLNGSLRGEGFHTGAVQWDDDGVRPPSGAARRGTDTRTGTHGRERTV